MPSIARFGLSTARMGGNLKKLKLFVESFFLNKNQDLIEMVVALQGQVDQQGRKVKDN